MITIIKKSLFSGKENSMDLPLTETEYLHALYLWKRGEMIQNAFHMLNADQREFLLTGSTPEEWNKLFETDEN